MFRFLLISRPHARCFLTMNLLGTLRPLHAQSCYQNFFLATRNWTSCNAAQFFIPPQHRTCNNNNNHNTLVTTTTTGRRQQHATSRNIRKMTTTSSNNSKKDIVFATKHLQTDNNNTMKITKNCNHDNSQQLTAYGTNMT